MTRYCATGRCRRQAAYVIIAHGEDENGTWSLQTQCCQVCLLRIVKKARRIGNEHVEPINDPDHLPLGA